MRWLDLFDFDALARSILESSRLDLLFWWAEAKLDNSEHAQALRKLSVWADRVEKAPSWPGSISRPTVANLLVASISRRESKSDLWKWLSLVTMATAFIVSLVLLASLGRALGPEGLVLLLPIGLAIRNAVRFWKELATFNLFRRRNFHAALAHSLLVAGLEPSLARETAVEITGVDLSSELDGAMDPELAYEVEAARIASGDDDFYLSLERGRLQSLSFTPAILTTVLAWLLYVGFVVEGTGWQ